MSGKRVTDRQVRRYMDSRKDGHIQVAAAARAGFSERTGRRIDGSPVLPSQRDRTRRYRTRQDPFAEVWRAELVPMLTAMPSLRATTLLEELQRRHPARYPDRMLRSLQRRVAHWRATEGPERELIFRQEHPPGLQALSDFTAGGGLGVTLGGEPFPHLLYHFWLAFSGWQYVKAICGGESFTALTEGVQEALWQLGGVPRTHRTDRLSAAYRNLSNQEDEPRVIVAFQTDGAENASREYSQQYRRCGCQPSAVLQQLTDTKFGRFRHPARLSDRQRISILGQRTNPATPPSPSITHKWSCVIPIRLDSFGWPPVEIGVGLDDGGVVGED
jgi:hypothetical protein